MKTQFASRGFTLVEVLIVISIMGVLASIATPHYMRYIENARSTACLVERGVTDKMIIFYCNEDNDNPLTNLSQLTGTAGYMGSQPQCPYGGEYVLIPADENHNYPRVGCSLHYWPEEEAAEPLPLTSLGSTFEEITGSMITLVQEFYDEKGRYPRSWRDHEYTDIGLDPDEWSDAFNGIIYSPEGDSIKVTPEKGYIFYVTDSDGEEKVLKSRDKRSLWYSMEDGEWYYKKIKDDNEIDISTLRVEKE
jgi:prepilin-type N-terminal cleavage/methylation domain-containing protein